MTELRCPACGTTVQPAWVRCLVCGYDPSSPAPTASGTSSTRETTAPGSTATALRERPAPASSTAATTRTPPRRSGIGVGLAVVVAAVLAVAVLGWVLLARGGPEPAPPPVVDEAPASTAPPAADGWRFVRPTGAGFIVEMPGTITSRTERGTDGTRHWTAGTDGSETFTAMWFDVPAGTAPSDAVARLTEGYGSNVAETTFKGHEAWAFRTQDQGTYTTGRAIVARADRVLVLIHTAPSSDLTRTNRFFDSLGID